MIAYNGSQEHLEHHRRGVKVERVYDCSDCDKAFTREEHLKRHAKSHTDEPVHRCEVVGCNKAYTRKERLTRHYKVGQNIKKKAGLDILCRLLIWARSRRGHSGVQSVEKTFREKSI